MKPSGRRAVPLRRLPRRFISRLPAQGQPRNRHAYRKINWEHTVAGTSGADDWRSPKA
jgi:hypothetical protein